MGIINNKQSKIKRIERKTIIKSVSLILDLVQFVL